MRAAIYVRASTDEQENSPDRQLSQVLPYCERKSYTVVGQYQDLAMRGYDDHRPDFKRLLKDATAGKFEVIVVDENTRLSRNDPLDYLATVAHPLRAAGILLDTVANGIRNWEDLGGIIVSTVEQHSSSDEIKKLSRRVQTELARKAMAGQAVTGKLPYGYGIAWADGTGAIIHVGKRTWQKTPAEYKIVWQVKEEQAEVVRWMFDAYANQDLSLNSIAKELHRRGIKSPRGNAFWNRAQIRNILRDRAYLGEYQFNQTCTSRFHQVGFQNGHPVINASKHKPKNGVKHFHRLNKQEDWVVIPNHHPALVSEEQFNRIGKLLQTNRERTTPKPSRGNYVLSKLLICSHCGSWMTGDIDATELRRKGGDEGKIFKYYNCGAYAKHGPQACRPYRVREEDAIDIIAGALKGTYADGSRFEQMRKEARELEAAKGKNTSIEPVKKMVSKLKKNIDKAKANLLLMDAEFIPQAQNQIRAWERELLAKRAELDHLSADKPVEDIEMFIKQRIENIVRFEAAFESKQPEEMRAALRRMISRVEMKFAQVKKAKLTRYPLESCVIRFLNDRTVGWTDPTYQLVENESPQYTRR